ncbi:hypothetical protein Holit_01574 [Hollandina sp. SP2]
MGLRVSKQGRRSPEGPRRIAFRGKGGYTDTSFPAFGRAATPDMENLSMKALIRFISLLSPGF